MNRYIGFIIFCICPLAVFADTAFGGAYVSVGAGLINTYYNGSRYVSTGNGANTIPFSADLDPYANNITLQGAAGYSYDYSSRYNFSFEANVSLNNASAQSNSVVDEYVNNIYIAIDSGFDLKSDASLLFKPGIKFIDNTLGYLLIGPRWGHFRINQGVQYRFGNHRGSTSTQYVTKNRIGFSVGLGVLQKLTKRLSMGLEYSYTDFGSLPEVVTYGTVYNNGAVSGSIASITKKSSATANKVLLNLVYRFL